MQQGELKSPMLFPNLTSMSFNVVPCIWIFNTIKDEKTLFQQLLKSVPVNSEELPLVERRV
jgi:hypothetical protein